MKIIIKIVICSSNKKYTIKNNNMNNIVHFYILIDIFKHILTA